MSAFHTTHLPMDDSASFEQFAHTSRRLFWSWMMVWWGVVLGLSFVTLILFRAQSIEHIRPELHITTTEAAIGLKNELDRALGLGIPFDQLAGMSVWLTDALETQPVLKGIALMTPQGQLLHHAGWSPEMWQKEWSKTSMSSDAQITFPYVWDQSWFEGVINAVPLHTPNTTSVLAYLVVAGESPPVPHRFWVLWCVVVLTIGCVGSAWLHYRFWKDIHQPLQSLNTLFSSLAQMRLPLWPWTSGHRTVLHVVLHHWVGQLHHTHTRRQALFDKLVEVKAAHFDLPVLQRLDALATTATNWLFESHNTATSTTHNQAKWRYWWTRQPLSTQLFLGIGLGVVSLAVLTWTWQQEQEKQQVQTLLHHQSSLVKLSWQTVLKTERVSWHNTVQPLLSLEPDRQQWLLRLQSYVEDENLSDKRAIHAMPSDSSVGSSATASASTPIDVWLSQKHSHVSLFDDQGGLLSTTAHKPERPYPAAVFVAAQASTASTSVSAETSTDPLSDELSGLWQGQDRTFQWGLIQRLKDTEGTWLLVWSQPLDVALKRLTDMLNAPVVLVDLRGQVIGADVHGLAASWRTHQRQSHRTWLSNGQVNGLFDIVAVPLISLSGHTSANLLVGFKASDIPWLTGAVSYVLAGLTLMVFACLCWGLWSMVYALAQFGQRVQHLVHTQHPEQAFDRDEVVHVSSFHLPALLLAADDLRQRINDFTVLRRSRDRQGRRQARFIRHQMMALAQRLDDSARQGILDDLARIEEVSKHQSTSSVVGSYSRGNRQPVNVEQVVDEIGILALGFQNLVHRVGDQYQQLAHLVQELREALEVKTQFIAIQQELEIARKMQLAILPQAFTPVGGFSIDARMLPAKEVGGDFYDFFALDEHHIAIAIADVSGKGIPAAFFMAVSRTLLRAVAPFDPSPSVCLSRLNNLLAADNPEMMFVTLFYAVLDTRTGRVLYGSAGHNPPYVVRKNACVPVEIPSLGNMALAVMEDMPYDQAEFVLESGDRLFLYTDGVTEAMSPTQELYGEERLMQLLADLQHTPASQVPELVLNVLHGFEGEGAQADDITTLVVHHMPDAAKDVRS